MNNFEGVRWGVQNSIKIKVGKEVAAPLSGAAAQLPCYLAQNRTETFLDFEYPTFQGAVSNDYSFCPEKQLLHGVQFATGFLPLFFQFAFFQYASAGVQCGLAF